jgi:hypothetical protein
MASILITGFAQKYTKGPEGALIPVEWVTWVPLHSPQSMSNTERVDRLNPDNIKGREGADDSELMGMKQQHMAAIWSEIEPAYLAWKEGREIPLNGTPLAAWPGITPEQAEIFRLAGVRSVEQVRDMSDTVRSKVRLPQVRELQDLARIFLENSGAAAAAEREAAKDRTIAEMQERMEAMEALLEQATRPVAQPEQEPEPEGDEVAKLRAQLDAKGIPYHHKAGPTKLRELLSQEAA